MRKLKHTVQEKIGDNSAVDTAIDKHDGDRALFQHKIDRLTGLLKGTKLDPALSQPKS